MFRAMEVGRCWDKAVPKRDSGARARDETRERMVNAARMPK
jgi:hypothetical protein